MIRIPKIFRWIAYFSFTVIGFALIVWLFTYHIYIVQAILIIGVLVAFTLLTGTTFEDWLANRNDESHY